MTPVTRPRRPLPRRVYWTRRILVLGVALALVFGIARLLDRGGDGAAPAAVQAGSSVTSPSAGLSAGATPGTGPTSTRTPAIERPQKTRHKPRKVKTPLAVPTGPCEDSDVRVEPSIDHAYAGQGVQVALNLTTVDAPACNWEVTPRSVVLKITSGSDRVWSTQDCPRAVMPASVVVRKDHQTKVNVVWNGQRSDSECSRTTSWALPGYYHAIAAAFGSEPTDTQFYLGTPPRPTITPTPKAQKKAEAPKRAKKSEGTSPR